MPIAFVAAALWLAAALLIVPKSLPTYFGWTLFSVQIAMAAAFIAFAVLTLKARVRLNVQPSRRGLILAPAAIAIAASAATVAYGERLSLPGDADVQRVVETLVTASKENVAQAYPSLKVHDTVCRDRFTTTPQWGCSFKVSYTGTDGQTITEGGGELLEISAVTGKSAKLACGLNFQWSRKIRQTPYYVSELEPIEWAGCSRNNGENQKFYYTNTIRRIKGQQSYGSNVPYIGLRIPTSRTAEGTPPIDVTQPATLDIPASSIAASYVKTLLGGDSSNVTCEDAGRKPDSSSISCEVSGTRTVTNAYAIPLSPYGNTQKESFNTRVELVPAQLKWTLKR